MGYRGKVAEQERARELRAEGKTLVEIARELGVSKSSVSLWVRDVLFTPQPRHRPTFVAPHPFHLAKLAEIEEMNRRGLECIAVLSADAFLAAGVALYAGEGSKTEGAVRFANSDPLMIGFFCAWFRNFFDVDEARLHLQVYLHQGLDLDRTEASGRSSPACPANSSARRTVRFPIHRFAETSTSTGAATSATRAVVRTERSWAS